MTRGDNEGLDLYAMNTGELYPARKAIVNRMKGHINNGTYSASEGWKMWVPWFNEAARRYRREIDSSVHFPRSEIVKAAKERAKDEYDAIKHGERDW